VRLWSPQQIGRATAVYSTGLLVGEGIPPAVALVLPATGSWELALAGWSLPVVAGALLIGLLTRRDHEPPDTVPRRWWPDWRSGRTWRLGLMLGADSALYWSCNAFIPQYLQHTGRSGLVAAALTALNVGQIPAGLAIASLPGSLLSKRWAYWGAGPLAAAGVAGLVLLPGGLPVAAAAALGFLSAWVFVLALALPPLIAEPPDVPRLAAAMFTITYVCSFSAPVIGGAVWDLSGVAPLVFAPGFVACLVVTAMAAGLRLPHRPSQLAPVAA
jgi:CP family cyanate transporter-like MFS transporter